MSWLRRIHCAIYHDGPCRHDRPHIDIQNVKALMEKSFGNTPPDPDWKARAESAEAELAEWKAVYNERHFQWLAQVDKIAKLQRVADAARRFVPDPDTIQWELRENDLRVALAELDNQGT